MRSPKRADDCAPSSTNTDPTPSRCTCPDRCRIESQYLATKLAKGFLRTKYIGVELTAVHGQRGHGIQAVARRRRPAGLLHRLRHHQPVLRDRLEHGRLPPDPVPADGRPAQGRRQADRRRPPAHRHRGKGRPFLQIRPGTDVALLNGLLHLLGDEQRRRYRLRVHRRAHRRLGRHARVPGRLPAGQGRPDHRASASPTCGWPPP